MSTREQLQAEAEELFPTDDTTYISIYMDDLNSDLQRAFIKGRTVSAEQVEAAVASMREQCPDSAPNWFDWIWHRFAHAAFRAAGFCLEGGQQ